MASASGQPLLAGEDGGRCLGFLPPSIRLKTSVWSELGGAVGDLGTYIPIVLALSLASHLDLGTTLIFTALYNFATGFIFGIPMPVQPMKSIAAVALSSAHLTVPQIMSAGLAVAAVLLFLGATGLMTYIYRLLPLPVVRGIQLSQGLSFAFTAVKYIRYVQDFSHSSSASTSVPRSLLGLDGLVLALAALLFIILATGSGDDEDVGTDGTRRRRRSCSRVPAALIVFALGLVLCFVRDPSIVQGLRFGPAPLRLVKITWDDFKIGFWEGAVPQLPLSVLNSVIAVCKLSSDLFPERAELSPARVSVSVGLMNFVGCWFGAMPCCHGAGGLAGQYRFGGRSGASVVFLAIGKLALGLVFGNSFVRILGQFPIGILGVMLLFSGIELAMASRDMGTKEESFVMLICASVSLTGSSAALGFISGIVLYLLLRLRDVDYRGLVGRWGAGQQQTGNKVGRDGDEDA
ncbi:molybdate transporter 2 [Phragmites australis]|uniref:molybdate transporter 2 n=1 Tax=Phragmites australis TaxID=29695 RepID=UPI002D79F158|nr:molybdate transporter 2 [Phragmites australis]XP_062216423.1 molybdate transporter 2 [Phragmites australis]